jgi:hypothetical protein
VELRQEYSINPYIYIYLDVVKTGTNNLLILQLKADHSGLLGNALDR